MNGHVISDSTLFKGPLVVRHTQRVVFLGAALLMMFYAGPAFRVYSSPVPFSLIANDNVLTDFWSLCE